MRFANVRRMTMVLAMTGMLVGMIGGVASAATNTQERNISYGGNALTLRSYIANSYYFAPWRYAYNQYSQASGHLNYNGTLYWSRIEITVQAKESAGGTVYDINSGARSLMSTGYNILYVYTDTEHWWDYGARNHALYKVKKASNSTLYDCGGYLNTYFMAFM